MPPDEENSGSPSKVGVVAKLKLDWLNLGLVIGEALSDVNIGELMSDWNGEFSANKKSSSSRSAQYNTRQGK